MDDMNADYNFYWGTNRFLENDELDRRVNDSFSPDKTLSCLINEKKNIIRERSRRRKLNDGLYILRSIVPNITKMDKPSIIQDAIVYLEELQEQERRMITEISEIESRKTVRSSIGENKQCVSAMTTGGKRRKLRRAANSPSTPSIEVIELVVRDVGDQTQVISLTCKKAGDTLMNICDVFQSLDLKIITANLNHHSGTLIHTLFVENGGVSCNLLKETIELAVAKFNAETTLLFLSGGMSYNLLKETIELSVARLNSETTPFDFYGFLKE